MSPRHIPTGVGTLQPKGTRICGQTVIAELLEWSIPSACMLVGHKHGTTAQDLRKALAKIQLRLGPTKLVLPYTTFPPVAIFRVSWWLRRNNWHWMLYRNGVIYDPAGSWPNVNKDAEITSYMEVTPGPRHSKKGAL